MIKTIQFKVQTIQFRNNDLFPNEVSYMFLLQYSHKQTHYDSFFYFLNQPGDDYFRQSMKLIILVNKESCLD
jgi:hypothetical protein